MESTAEVNKAHTYRPSLGAVTSGQPRAEIDLNDTELKPGMDAVCEKLVQFYSDPAHFETLVRLNNGEMGLPLRYIDYLVTKYSKKYQVSYMVQRVHGTETFNVYAKYHSLLNSGFKKEYADPFRRGPRVFLRSADGTKTLRTTVAQLNFFMWAIENKVLDFTLKHRDHIGKDLSEHRKHARLLRKRKRGEKIDDVLYSASGDWPAPKPPHAGKNVVERITQRFQLDDTP